MRVASVRRSSSAPTRRRSSGTVRARRRLGRPQDAGSQDARPNDARGRKPPRASSRAGGRARAARGLQRRRAYSRPGLLMPAMHVVHAVCPRPSAPFVRLAVAALVLASPSIVGAQLPGAPVLQNAFSNPGVTVAANYADGDGTSLIAAAVAWSPGTGRFQFSGGAGQLKVDDADFSAPAWGARVAVPCCRSRTATPARARTASSFCRSRLASARGGAWGSAQREPSHCTRRVPIFGRARRWASRR